MKIKTDPKTRLKHVELTETKVRKVLVAADLIETAQAHDDRLEVADDFKNPPLADSIRNWLDEVKPAKSNEPPGEGTRTPSGEKMDPAA